MHTCLVAHGCYFWFVPGVVLAKGCMKKKGPRRVVVALSPTIQYAILYTIYIYSLHNARADCAHVDILSLPRQIRDPACIKY